MPRNSTSDLLQRLYRWETRSIVASKSGYTQKFGVTKVTQSKYDCIFIFACLKVRIFIHDFPPYLSVILLFGRNNTVSFTTQTAVIRGTLLALDYMRKDRGGNGGTIVNVSSMAGNQGPSYNTQYTYVAKPHRVFIYHACMIYVIYQNIINLL